MRFRLFFYFIIGSGKLICQEKYHNVVVDRKGAETGRRKIPLLRMVSFPLLLPLAKPQVRV